MLEQERGEQRNRQVMLKEAMRELEDEVQGLSQKLSGVEEELNGFRNECSILRQDTWVHIYTHCATTTFHISGFFFGPNGALAREAVSY